MIPILRTATPRTKTCPWGPRQREGWGAQRCWDGLRCRILLSCRKPALSEAEGGLVRFQQCGVFHFLTFSCYRRQPLLGNATAGCPRSRPPRSAAAEDLGVLYRTVQLRGRAGVSRESGNLLQSSCDFYAAFALPELTRSVRTPRSCYSASSRRRGG